MKCKFLVCLLNIQQWQKYVTLTVCQQWRTWWPEVRSLIRDYRSSRQCSGMLWYPTTLCQLGIRDFCCGCNPQYPELGRSSVTIIEIFLWKFISTLLPLHNQATRQNANYVQPYSLNILLNKSVNCKFAKSSIRTVEPCFYEILTVTDTLLSN